MYRAETMYTMDAMRESVTTLVAERDAGIIGEDAFARIIIGDVVSSMVFGDDELVATAAASFTDELIEDAVSEDGITDDVLAAIDAFVAAMLA